MYWSIIVTLVLAIIYWLDAPNQIASAMMSVIFKKEMHIQLRKPFGCQICMTFWITLFILLIIQPQLWWMSFVLAYLSKYLYFIIDIIDKLLMKIFIIIDNKLN